MAMDDLNLKRELLEQLRELKRIRKQSVRKGRPDLATGATAQMVQIAKMLADLGETVAGAKAQTPGCCRNCGAKIPETVWKVSYEDPGAQPDQVDAAVVERERTAAIRGIREALGNEKLPRAAERNMLITSLASFFQVRREFAEFVIAELEKGKENGEWEDEYHAHSNQKLLPESSEEDARDEGQDAEPQPDGSDAA